MCVDRTQGNVRCYFGTSVIGKPGCDTCFFVVLWPVLGVGFVLLDWSVDRSFKSAMPFIGHASIVFASVCVGAYALPASRSAGHWVVSPEVKQRPSGVLVVADSKFDPHIASVVLRTGCAVVSLGLAAALTLWSDGSDRRSVTLVFSIILFAVGIFFLVRVVQFWTLRRASQQYPGDVELFPEGVRQRYGNFVACASWKDIESWRGAKRNDLGLFRDLWNTASAHEASFPASRNPVAFQDRRLQCLTLVLNPVSDVRTMHTLIDVAQSNPGWVHELFSSHDRAERVANILSAPIDEKPNH